VTRRMNGRVNGWARALAWAVATVALLALPVSAAAVVLPDPGHAVDDTLTVARGGNAGLDVTANDVVDGGFQLELLSGPAHGRVEGRQGSPGWFQYFPDATFSGADSFRYQLGFDDGSVSVGTVRITVTAPTRTTTTTTTTTTRPTTTTTRPTTTTTTTTRPTTTTGGGQTGCAAALTVGSAWNGGFVAGVKVTAASAISGWKVTLTLPSGTGVANAWNGTASGTTGTVTVTNAAYNGALAAGQGTEFGFQGTGSATGITASCAPA
jgi:hypothetical protein